MWGAWVGQAVGGEGQGFVGERGEDEVVTEEGEGGEVEVLGEGEAGGAQGEEGVPGKVGGEEVDEVGREVEEGRGGW